MAGRPSKPADVIQLEGISHRTKEEIAQRKEAESALVTGIHMEMWPEVRANKIAREEFERVCDLLGVIGKADALQEGVVNRYCLLRAECVDFEKKRDSFNRSLAELKREFKAGKMDTGVYFGIVANMQKNLIGLDRQIQSKRNMMLAIEKENLMTIASALRSIPKKAEKPKAKSGIAKFMAERAESG
jgi:phage terminase small subunit